MYRFYSLNPVCSKFVSNNGVFQKIEVRIFKVHDTMGLSAVCDLVFPGHTHLLFLMYYTIIEVVIIM